MYSAWFHTAFRLSNIFVGHTHSRSIQPTATLMRADLLDPGPKICHPKHCSECSTHTTQSNGGPRFLADLSISADKIKTRTFHQQDQKCNYPEIVKVEFPVTVETASFALPHPCKLPAGTIGIGGIALPRQGKGRTFGFLDRLGKVMRRTSWLAGWPTKADMTLEYYPWIMLARRQPAFWAEMLRSNVHSALRYLAPTPYNNIVYLYDMHTTVCASVAHA